MTKHIPEKITVKRGMIQINWTDGTSHVLPLNFLRANAPDEISDFFGEDPTAAGYDIDGIDQVGNYGIRLKWSDGYDTGIYSYEILYKYGEYIKAIEGLHKDM